MRSFFLFLLLSLSLPLIPRAAGLMAQTVEKETLRPLEFSEETLRAFKEDPDFDYSEQADSESWWTKFKRYLKLQWQRFLQWIFGDYQAPLLLAIFLDVLPYLLLGLLLALVLYLFSKLNPGTYFFGSPQEGEVQFEGEEKIIRTRDIQRLIDKAVSKENYRLAVRYHFLYLLQQLSRLEIVTYDSAKTDEEYVLEIQDPTLRSRFKRVNRIYDFVWYGNFETTAQDYLKIKEEFTKTTQLIQVPS